MSASTAPAVPSTCTRRSTRGSTVRGRTSRRMPTTPRRSAIETKSAQRATSSRHVMPDAPTASVGGGGVDADPEREDAVTDVAVGGQLAPADGVGLPDAEPADGRADHEPAVPLRDGAGDLAAVRRVHHDRVGRRDDGLVEPQLDHGRRRVDPALHAGLRALERRVRARRRRQGEREERRRRERPPHGAETRPARSERWPKIGATSRSANSITASAIHVAANPYAQTARRGLNASPIGKTLATTSVQPIRWWRNADRAKSQPFCSWTRNDDAGEEERGGRDERPVGRREPAAHDRELHRAGRRRRLRPERVREQVERREGGEDRDDPEPDAREERERRPEARPPATAAGRRQAPRSPRRAGRGQGRGSRPRRASARSQPVASSGRALCRSRSSTTPGATSRANASPTATTSRGGCTSQSHRSFPSG